MSFQYIRDISISNIELDEQTFEPHQRITIDFYFEAVQDLRGLSGEALDESYRAIGKQLVDAMWKRLAIQPEWKPKELG